MQLATNLTAAIPVSKYSTEDDAADRDPQRYAHYKVIRRNGVVRVICKNPRHKQRQG